jgi:DNA-binding beta-propeller fold protein YncE
MAIRRLFFACALVLLTAATAGAGTAGAPSVVAEIPLGTSPCAAIGSNGLLWVSNYGESSVRMIDPATNRRVGRPLPVGFQPCGMSAGGGSVWVNGYGTNTVVKINPRQRRVAARIRVGFSPFDVLFAARSAWSSDNGSGWVSRIDPRRNKVVRKIRTGEAPAGFAYAAGSVWVGSTRGTAIFRIDPATNKFQRIDTGHSGPAWLASTDEFVWASAPDGTVTRISTATNSVVGVTQLEEGALPVDGTVGPDGLVWVPLLRQGQIVRIDATGAIVDEFPTVKGPFVLTLAFGDIWAPDYAGTSVMRLRP